ncbi:DUF2920 family protein [Lachnoclostridium sp.]|uniref:DUF2920 family protein n=1 Tax=Lachnoclostridium sp. TaxID=2028282 RepID=UPI0028A2C58B|nr:DUF2920 family protein [Lachnoclostridium sp.]
MAKDYELEFIGQTSFYSKKERNVKMYFSEPENGVNKETGILLNISGYGGHSNSNIYKKMRTQFADQYNLMTLQCDYLGWEFMQGPKEQFLNEPWYRERMTPEVFEGFLQAIKLGDATEYYKEYGLKLCEHLEESLDNYNDQGILQAIDNLDALKILLDILDSNGFIYNKRMILAMGHSHGAYIAYLCNRYQPNVFSMIIDNSSYLYPIYLNVARGMRGWAGYVKEIAFTYLVSKMRIDTELYDMNSMYENFDNKATILSFHGINDSFLSLQEKREFLAKIPNTILEVIDENRINDIFKSCNHGLDADFIKLFDYVWQQYPQHLVKKEDLKFIEHEINTCTHCYKVDMSLGVPRLLINV